MSATFKIAKKKYTQNDLRRLMNEQKSKLKPSGEQKVESPLAKYNDAGQLTCILCKSVVRSESVWKVHVNTKQHKENVTAAKQLKERLESKQNAYTFKRPAPPPEETVPGKKSKENARSIKTSESDKSSSPIPTDFFDSNTSNRYFEATLNKTSIKRDLINIKRELKSTSTGNDEENSDSKIEVDPTKDELLPEGFFDDPVKDARVRNTEYRDPNEEEWERFQREIKEESTVSNAIIAEEQEEATAERQIEEIDEQIRKWSRVLDLEKKKEAVITKAKERSKKLDEKMDMGSSDESGGEFDEYFDWRSKRSHNSRLDNVR